MRNWPIRVKNIFWIFCSELGVTFQIFRIEGKTFVWNDKLTNAFRGRLVWLRHFLVGHIDTDFLPGICWMNLIKSSSTIGSRVIEACTLLSVGIHLKYWWALALLTSPNCKNPFQLKIIGIIIDKSNLNSDLDSCRNFSIIAHDASRSFRNVLGSNNRF